MAVSISARYITAKRSISEHDLELMRHWISGLTYQDIEQLKKEFILDINLEDKEKMEQDFRVIMKDFE